jgi:predicted Rossmann fold flavoprotein
VFYLKSIPTAAGEPVNFRFVKMQFDVIVVGGGAAGFFAAINLAEMRPDLTILIVEKSPKLLSKVRVSGGGRCNVTHHCFEATSLSTHYPRGEKMLRQVFREYQAKDVVDWFERKGVQLKAEQDGRMFPVSDSSETIIGCFLEQARLRRIKIELNRAVSTVLKNDVFTLTFQDGGIYSTRSVIVATGGSPSVGAYQWLADLNLKIASPIPSLFTFNDSGKLFKDLMGVSVPNAFVRIAATKFTNAGPLLITHWGLSGPAVIRLSAWAAEFLHEVNYRFTALVSWIGDVGEEEVRGILNDLRSKKVKQKVYGGSQFNLPVRLWNRLVELSEISADKVWSELPNKNLNKLLEHLIRCPFHIVGKTTFKEEFVTCGGVDLAAIHPLTMECRSISGLYFAGEVLNIDGETGGFNFQAAWSTAYLAARHLAENLPGDGS